VTRVNEEKVDNTVFSKAPTIPLGTHWLYYIKDICLCDVKIGSVQKQVHDRFYAAIHYRLQ